MFKLSRCLPAIVASFAAAFAIAPNGAQAQTYPSKPVHLVVAFGPGTSTDIVTRLIGNALSKELGQSFVIENRPGAGGSIGTNVVAKSAPDGYMLTMGTVGTHAINAGLFAKLPYDPLKEFVPIAVIGYTPTLLVVPKALPVQNVAELIALSKSQPNGLNFASAGTGTSGHLAGELVKHKMGAKLQHVPYKEGGMAVTDVITGQVQFMFYHPAAVLPHIKAGTLRAIGVSSARRSAAAPEVPTMIEQGVAGFDLVAWFALYAPAGTPAAIVTKLRDATNKVLGDATIANQLKVQGVELMPLTSDQLTAFTQNEVAKWTEIVKQAGARIE